MSRSINIISFDVPFPANYGGVIDVYYKLVWLKKMDVKVYLHCFQYGRKESAELAALCEKVYYYPRKTGFISNLSSLPYTVKSRQSAELEGNLLANDYPILFEVLHTCYLMEDPRFKDRIKIYRHSNIEHEYYRHLAKAEKNIFKKIYLNIEAGKLQKFEKVISHANYIMAVNELDAVYFKRTYRKQKTLYIPSFHPNDSVMVKAGQGDYILYHGNLSVSENYEAAAWLLENVFSKIRHQVIIAGLNPPSFLKKRIEGLSNVKLQENPADSEMKELISNAQVHCLYTAQATGLKLKLLNVLFGGRFVVCNEDMLAGTGFTGNSGLLVSEKFIEEINLCFQKNFSDELVEERKQMLEKFSNEKNIRRLLDAIFETVSV